MKKRNRHLPLYAIGFWIITVAVIFMACKANDDPPVPGSVLPTEPVMVDGIVYNPVIWSDVPDIAVIRVDNAYYMTSTTMHMNPGVPVMKSYDLVNWRIISYCYDVFAEGDKQTLSNNQQEYGYGSWASSIRYRDKWFYVVVFSQSAGKTTFYRTRNPEESNWEKISDIIPHRHDQSLVFDENGRAYLIYDGVPIKIEEFQPDLSASKGPAQVLISTEMVVNVLNQVSSGGNDAGLCEGSQLYILSDKQMKSIPEAKKYNLFLINNRTMRSVLCFRADSLDGTWEGKVVLRDNYGFTWGSNASGVAQGTIIDTPDGDWFGMFFQDHGAVGRSPCLVPMVWTDDGWPDFSNGNNNPPAPNKVGQVPASFDKKVMENPEEWVNLWGSDEFDGSALPLFWQWNHNPVNENWSLSARPGYLRLIAGIPSNPDTVLSARNTLTQRTYGPVCTGTVKLDIANMKPGDIAGFIALQKNYGFVYVEKASDGTKTVKMCSNTGTDYPSVGTVRETVPLADDVDTVYFKIAFDFGTYKTTQGKDYANFFYSLDETTWSRIGTNNHPLTYSFPQHFMGYRFGLVNYATVTAGGYVDFDYFRMD